MNCVPISVIMEFETPKQYTMSRKKATFCLDVIVFRGLVSIHLVNLSTATSKCVYPPGSLWSGPTRSSTQIMNDHMMGYCLQRLHRQVGPSRVELTTLLGVCDHSWPIEPLSENVPTKDLGAAWCPQMPPWMSSTSCFPCLVGMQLLQDPCATSLIQLLYDHDEGLGQTCQTPSVGFIREEYAVEEVSEEGFRPVC